MFCLGPSAQIADVMPHPKKPGIYQACVIDRTHVSVWRIDTGAAVELHTEPVRPPSVSTANKRRSSTKAPAVQAAVQVTSSSPANASLDAEATIRRGGRDEYDSPRQRQDREQKYLSDSDDEKKDESKDESKSFISTPTHMVSFVGDATTVCDVGSAFLCAVVLTFIFATLVLLTIRCAVRQDLRQLVHSLQRRNLWFAGT